MSRYPISEFGIGTHVTAREGGALDHGPWHKRYSVGTVIEAADLPGYGEAVRVQWRGEQPSPAFMLTDHLDIVAPAGMRDWRAG